MFEIVILVILGVLVGAELINAFMLGLLRGFVSPVPASVVKEGTSSNRIM
jgi:hypothetical protein